MESGRCHCRNDVAKFHTYRTVQGITDILTEGWINRKLRLRLLHKVAVPGRGGREVYEFGFVDGDSQMHAVSFQLSGKHLYEALERGYEHIVQGIIRARPTSTHSINSNTPFDLMLFEVTVFEKYRSNDCQLAQPSGILGIIGQLESGETTGPFSFDLQDVSIVGGDLYRYFGCPHCQKSLPFPDSKGKYCCLKCPEGPGERKREMFMYIKNLTIQDRNNNISVGGIAAYNNTCESIIGQQAGSFSIDAEGQAALENVFGAEADLTIRFQQSTHFRKYSERILVAIQVKLIPREGNEWHEYGEENWQVDKGVDSFGPISDKTTIPDENDWGQKNKILRVTASKSASYEDRKRIRPGGYSLNSDPSGYTLIINNFSFLRKRRRGSECDVKALCNLFPYLNMPIYKQPFIDINSTDLLEILKDFQSFLAEKEADSCAVVIMSHGSENIIGMTDGVPVNLYDDILDHFSDEEFPLFAGKPKIFIVEACQNFKFCESSKKKYFEARTYSDMVVCLPQRPGHLSNRPPSGSVYIQALCEVFQECAGELNLRHLLQQLQENMKHIIIQAPVDPSDRNPKSDIKEYRQKPIHLDFCFQDLRFNVLK